MTKKKTTRPTMRGNNVLSREDAARLADSIMWHFYDDGNELAHLMLLLYCFTYERDMTNRENMLTAIQEKAAPCMNPFDDIIHAEMERAYNELRKGGAADV